MEERRKYVRIPESLHISYKCVSKAKIDDHITKDISQGGIRFFVHEFIPKGTHMRIKLDLSGTLVTVETMVSAVWIRSVPYGDEYEVGVQFIDMPPHAAAHLINYIKDFFRSE